MTIVRGSLAGLFCLVAGFCVLLGPARAAENKPDEKSKAATAAPAASKVGWVTDFEKAKAKAKAEKKLLLVDFTGSDWCVWCKRLKQEVFDKEQFQDEIAKQFVLVELDYPHEKELPKALQEQNSDLQKKYNIAGFPTILLMDAGGEVIARTGYQAGGPEPYLKHLDKFREVYASLQDLKHKLEKIQGIDRVKLLDQAVALNGELNNEGESVVALSKEIVKLDPENKSGLKFKHEYRVVVAAADQFKQNSRHSEAIAEYEKAAQVPQITDEQKQDAYFAQGECYFNEKDFTGVVKSLKKAADAAPNSPKAGQLKGMIGRFEELAKAQEAVRTLRRDLEKLAGIDRAKRLDQLVEAQSKLGLPTGDPAAANEIEQWTKEILALDAENKAGLKSKYECRRLATEAAKLMRSRQPDKAAEVLEKALALPGITGEQVQQIRIQQATICMAKGQSKAAVESLKKALDAAPKTPIARLLKSRIDILEKQLDVSKPRPEARNDDPKKNEAK